jgi:hypothetical protein
MSQIAWAEIPFLHCKYNGLMRTACILLFYLLVAGCNTSAYQKQKDLLEADQWGQLTQEKAEFYAAADVSPDVVVLTKEWHEIGTRAWGNYGPLEFWIVGSSPSAAKELEKKYVAVRIQKDNSVSREAYEDRDHGFVSYAKEGNAGLGLIRNEYEKWSGYIITMSSKSPSPIEEDYKSVLLHEYFHVYQNAHIHSRDIWERASRSQENPWWTEGGAEYMAQLLYSQQAGVRPNYLKEVMTWKLRSLGKLSDGQGIQNIPYDHPDTIIAYDLGAWFIAFLVHKTSEEAYRVHFFEQLNEAGFEKAFFNSFGASHLDFLHEFHSEFLPTSLQEKLDILPEG